MRTKTVYLILAIIALGTITAFAQNHKENNTPPSANNNVDEASVLIQKLSKDKLVNEFEGFLVEKKDNKLFINGKQQTDGIADKYLASLKQESIRVEVFPFKERFKQHPNANILQLLTPVLFSSPCIKKTTKEGC